MFEHSPPTVPPIVELCGCVCVGGWLRPFKDTAWHRSRMASGCSRACAWCSLQLLDAALHSRGNGRVLHFVTSTPIHPHTANIFRLSLRQHLAPTCAVFCFRTPPPTAQTTQENLALKTSNFKSFLIFNHIVGYDIIPDEGNKLNEGELNSLKFC